MTDEQTSRSLPSAIEELVEHIVSQATVQIDKEHNAFVVACGISFDSVEIVGDRRAEWQHKYALEPHVRAMLLRDLCGYDWTTLHTTLETDDCAQTLGYDPEKFPEGANAPHRTTLYRAWNDYFGEQLRRGVKEAGRRIREYARESGNLIGKQQIDAESKEDASRRTKYRIKRQTADEMAAMFRRMFYDELDLNLPEDADYEKADLLDLFLHMALRTISPTTEPMSGRRKLRMARRPPVGTHFAATFARLTNSTRARYPRCSRK